MKLQPIIKAKLNRFREVRDISNVKDSLAFEQFANEMVLSNHQAGGISISDDLLAATSVGGTDDMGIDGIGIKLDGILIETLDDAKDIILTRKSAEIEFIFVQSKYKDKFDSGEYAKFINGVTDFLNDTHYQPMNDAIKKWLAIKDYLMSNEIMLKWTDSPIVRLYYVVMGTWNESEHIIAISKKFEDDVRQFNSYGEIYINYIDTERFKKLCDDNENQFSAVINIIDTFSLTAVNNVDNSNIILCSADELMHLLITDDGILRKQLFNDNVRDYQGETVINESIYHTIKTEPESFVLMNNGVTIICTDMNPGNRKVTIKNPQIVNGCQTCSVLYRAYRKGIDISKVVISAKIISTNDPEITNKVIRGTNRQNIVYDEAFECTRPFHKELEELFSALSTENPENRIFYERRSKQFADNPTVKSSEKISFRILIQSFVSVFLNCPHKGHKHESKLLQEFKNKIFIDTQSKLPYYVSCLMYSNTEQMFKKHQEYRNLKTYKFQILLIIRELCNNDNFSINNEKNIDSYCEKILTILYDNEKFENVFLKAIAEFNRLVSSWTDLKGETYKYGVKDSADFTQYMLDNICSEQKFDVLPYRGTVIKISIDRHKHYYGFISKQPNNIFFHSADNRDIDFPNMLNKDVVYEIEKDPVNNMERAINIQIV